jgi:hypothetical protein
MSAPPSSTRLTFVCPYCGALLDVTTREVRELRVAVGVGEPTRIDVEFVSRHMCPQRAS